MRPHVRGRSGPSGGAWRHTATPPSSRTVRPLSVAAATSRLDSATGSPSGRWPAMSRLRLTGREEEVDIAAVVSEVDDCTAQHVGGVIAARIKAHRPADLLRGARVMDGAIPAHHRLGP